MAHLRRESVIFLLAGLIVLAGCWRAALPASRFARPSPLDSDGTRSIPAAFERRLIQRADGIQEVHSAALVRLPGGDLLTVCFGGSSECALDVVLYQARFRNGAWEKMKVVMSPQAAGRAEHRYVRRLGNPSLHRDEQGRLHLFFVSTSMGGWSVSSINQMISTDDGETWSDPQRLITSPFFNLSMLVRHPAVPLQDGGFALPIYHELCGRYGEILRFDAAGRFACKTRMHPQRYIAQPCLVPLDERHAVTYVRNNNESIQQLLQMTTSDGGATWTAPQALPLPGFDAPVAAVRLRDGTLLIAYNPSRDREEIRLAASTDGKTWTDLMTLDEKGTGAKDGYDEYAYPTMLLNNDTIDLTYSYRRTAIRHLRFNAAWVRERR